MEHLKINNFGAIKNAELDIKKYNIFIGDTSSGKSTAAKLIAIFNSPDFFTIENGDFKSFEKLLENYNIDFDFETTTLIEYTDNKCFWKITKENFSSNFNENNKLDSPIYIPAERLLISIYTDSIFSFLRSELNIPSCVKDFGGLYEKAKKSAKTKHKSIDIDVFNISISFEDTVDKILLKDENKEIRFAQASSGMQTTVPLWVVFNYYVEEQIKRTFIIEEPELNLFPTTQAALIEHLMGKMKNSDSKIVITTHSPYILSTLDNLISANEILKNSADKEKTETALKALLPSMALVDFDKVSSYYFSTDGIVKNILDTENKLIGAEYIDEASNSSSKLFNDLWNLENNEL